MSVTGHVGGFGAAELLPWLTASGRTGTLRVERAGFRKFVALDRGSVVSCSTARAKERLGVRLLVGGLITQAELRDALEDHCRRRQRFGRSLLELELLTRGELDAQLEQQSRDSLVDLLTWDRVSFSFNEGRLPPPDDRRTPRSWADISNSELPRAVARAARARRHPQAGLRFRVNWARACALTGADALTDALLCLAARGHPVEWICLALHEHDHEILDLVAEHRASGVLHDRGWAGETRPSRDAQQVLGRIGQALESGEILRPLMEAEAAAERWMDDELVGRCRRGVRRLIGNRSRRRLGDLDATVVPATDVARSCRQGLDPLEEIVLSRTDGQTSFRLVSRLMPFGEELALAALANLVSRRLVRAA